MGRPLSGHYAATSKSILNLSFDYVFHCIPQKITNKVRLVTLCVKMYTVTDAFHVFVLIDCVLVAGINPGPSP